jgi:hypothetical protein
MLSNRRTFAMLHLVRSILVIVGASALTTGTIQVPENVLEVVVVNGPFAGTYKPPTKDVICYHNKKEKIYTATWKDFNAHDAKAIDSAGINVSNPDDAGAKRGDVRITFGDPGQKPTMYSVYQEPLTLTIKGKGSEIAFQGQTKDGIQLRVNAKCLDVDEF